MGNFRVLCHIIVQVAMYQCIKQIISKQSSAVEMLFWGKLNCIDPFRADVIIVICEKKYLQHKQKLRMRAQITVVVLQLIVAGQSLFSQTIQPTL